MVQTFKTIAVSAWFTNLITIVILIAGVLVGIETYPNMVAAYGGPLHVLDQIVLWIFVVEVVVKMLAEGNRPWRYFLDPWNVFDFSIVAAAFMPFGGSSVAVLRLARLLRVLKLVRALPKLQVLVTALLRSIPSMGYVSILLIMLFYVYAVAAVLFFGQNDPVHFKDLPLAMLSLFRAVTLEDWTDLMYINMYGCANYGYDGNPDLCTNSSAHPVGGAVFFVSFVLIGTMIILNLFIGVIMNGMDEARAEQLEDERAAMIGHRPTVHENVLEIQKKMNELSELVNAVEKLSLHNGHPKERAN
ncbi:MAG: ion transporter [Spirochaetales bacterium]|nr:ion transporter [Spirochaetales bacterium]MCP5483908.1 ion transporter [Spirochaetales bacterium]